ncbi:hypothetical protein [Microvirga pudoricolor]|uniref:hypothetical protein n=1 Tax=Microvirga pudoricolor TaxID=2778729 RepID=UPI001950611B|nr:hypothetical protein [Microvirga pudoricolor]MBM6595845.1 hypothetical protein [Microvirga pudoricolor]
MEPYSAWADALSKFHTASEPIQALCIVALAATIIGVTWCMARVLRDVVRALAGQGAAYVIALDGQGRWVVRRVEDGDVRDWRQLPVASMRHDMLSLPRQGSSIHHEPNPRHGRA